MAKFKAGDKVRYRGKLDDGGIYQVYAVYSDTEVSLGLHDYPDVEQDILTNVKDLVKVK